MIVLGIESSCDDTSVAFVKDNREVLANVISSQIDIHARFGGVVPEIAARSHLDNIDITFNEAIKTAQININDIDAVAATCGPGLIGGIIVGSNFAKMASLTLKKPFFAINHIEAHALSARLSYPKIKFPYLLLLVSGGHCIICLVKTPVDFQVLGNTIDDSVGESFDKVAKMLGLRYPGGPEIQKYAKNGEPCFELPKPLYKKQGCDMSFSGLKTAVRRIIESNQINTEEEIANMCASFQKTIAEILFQKCEHAIKICKENSINVSDLVIGGGVAANLEIREKLSNLSNIYDLNFFAPPFEFCTDNAAMIAWNAIEKINFGVSSSPLTFKPVPRWPLGIQQ